MTIRELASRLSSLNLGSLKLQAVENKRALLEDLQRKQLRQGQDADGQALKAYRSKPYADYKSTLSTYFAPIGVPDLFLSGDFHRGIRMKLSGNEYLFDSSDSKSGELGQKYGHIFDLNPTSLKQARIACQSEFNKLVLEQIGT